MGAFQYEALDVKGRSVCGYLEGDNAKHIRKKLRGQNLIPVDVSEVSPKGEKKHTFLHQRIYAGDLALITRQLATLLRSGTVLEEALDVTTRQTESPALKKILASLRARVREGHSLASALNEYSTIFPEIYSASVFAGEQAGQLDTIFERLADYIELKQKIKKKLTMALVYPLLLTIVSFFIVAGILTYVVPQVVTVFDHLGQTLPLLTRILIALSSTLQENSIVLLLLSLIFPLFLWRLSKQTKIQYLIDRILLSMPLTRRFIKSAQTAHFARALSILNESGVSLVESLHTSAMIIGNLPMRKAVLDSAKRVREGGCLHETLAQSGFFPPITIQLIAIGEASSNLGEMLDKAAHIHEEELNDNISICMSIFEPLLILIMGSIVLLIVLAVLLPIMDMNQLIR